jgi:hypothetical protein
MCLHLHEHQTITDSSGLKHSVIRGPGRNQSFLARGLGWTVIGIPQSRQLLVSGEVEICFSSRTPGGERNWEAWRNIRCSLLYSLS